MPHRPHVKVFYTNFKSFTNKDILLEECKRILAGYVVTMQDFCTAVFVVNIDVLFIDIYENHNNYYIVTNCVIVDHRFQNTIKNDTNQYKLFKTITQIDIKEQIKMYEKSDQRCKESALFAVFMQRRGLKESNGQFYKYLQTKEGKKTYKNAFNFFKKEYKK